MMQSHVEAVVATTSERQRTGRQAGARCLLCCSRLRRVRCGCFLAASDGGAVAMRCVLACLLLWRICSIVGVVA